MIYLTLFTIGIIGGFVGNFVSGTTTLIGITSMLFLGINPYLALATQSVGTLGWRLGGLKSFKDKKKILWKYVIPLSIIAFIGSTIGANILIRTNEIFLNKILGTIILIFIPILFMKKTLGIENIRISKTRAFFGYFLYFIISIWSGFFSAGSGIFFLYVYIFGLGFTILELKGTDKIPGMFLDVGTIIVFFTNNVFNPYYLLAFVPGMILGSSLGAKYAIIIGDKRLKFFILISVFLMSLKLLF